MVLLMEETTCVYVIMEPTILNILLLKAMKKLNTNTQLEWVHTEQHKKKLTLYYLNI